jgi:hypothetical protein
VTVPGSGAFVKFSSQFDSTDTDAITTPSNWLSTPTATPLAGMIHRAAAPSSASPKETADLGNGVLYDSTTKTVTIDIAPCSRYRLDTNRSARQQRHGRATRLDLSTVTTSRPRPSKILDDDAGNAFATPTNHRLGTWRMSRRA